MRLPLKTILVSTTARFTYLTSAADIGMAGMAAITTAIIARQLSPDHFGIFIVVWTILTLLSGLLDLGISTGIVNFISRQSNINQQRHFIATGFWFLLAIGFLVASLITIISAWLQAILFTNIPVQWIAFAAQAAVILMLAQYANNCLRARLQFTQAAMAILAFGILRLGLIITLALNFNLNLTNTLQVMCWSPLIYFFVGYSLLGWPLIFQRPQTYLLRQLFQFSRWIGVSQLFSMLASRADVLLLNRLAGATSAGLYGTAGLMVRIWIVLTSSLDSVFAPRLLRFGQPHQQRLFLQKIALLTISLWLPILGTAMLAKPLLILIFGSRYLPALPPFYWLTAAVAVLIATIPVTLPVIYLLKRPDVIARLAILQLTITIFGNLFLVPLYGASAPGMVMLVNHLIVFTICAWWTSRWWRSPQT